MGRRSAAERDARLRGREALAGPTRRGCYSLLLHGIGCRAMQGGLGGGDTSDIGHVLELPMYSIDSTTCSSHMKGHRHNGEWMAGEEVLLGSTLTR